MSRYFNGSNDNVLIGFSPPATAAPLTISCWFRADDVTNARTLVALMDVDAGAGLQRFRLWVDGSVAGDPVKFLAGEAAASDTASTSSGYSANTWHHACAVASTVSSRAVFIDGGSKGTATGSITPAGVEWITIGGDYVIGNVENEYAGNVAHVAVWNAALTDAEVLSLAKGADPRTIRPGSLAFYAPLDGRSPEADMVGGESLTISLTSYSAEEPRVFRARGPVATHHEPRASFPATHVMRLPIGMNGGMRG